MAVLPAGDHPLWTVGRPAGPAPQPTRVDEARVISPTEHYRRGCTTPLAAGFQARIPEYLPREP